MPKAEMWPYNFDKLEKGRMTFAPVIATVEGVFDQRGFGLSFAEDKPNPARDNRKPIWSCQGAWDDALNNGKGGRAPYTGFRPTKGQKVDVLLAHRVYTKQDGTEGEAFDVVKMLPAKTVTVPADPDPDAPLPFDEPAKPTNGTKPHPEAIGPDDKVPPEYLSARSYYERKNREERSSIQEQSVFKGIVEILTSDSAHFDVAEIEQLKANLFGLIDRLAPGLPIAIAAPADATDIDGPAEPAA